MASQRLMNVLTTPSRIASKLDWKKKSGSILSLNIHKDRIGAAVASHPTLEEQAQSIENILLDTNRGQNNVSDETVEHLADIIQEHNVCGVVVSWPVQRDTGRMGAACGRVLHTLDNLLEAESSDDIVTRNRPLCLWDGVPSKQRQQEQQDEWGRCSSYCRTTNKNIHIASKEQYSQDEKIKASQMWDEFCRVHWPDLHKEPQSDPSSPSSTTSTPTLDVIACAGDWDMTTSNCENAM